MQKSKPWKHTPRSRPHRHCIVATVTVTAPRLHHHCTITALSPHHVEASKQAAAAEEAAKQAAPAEAESAQAESKTVEETPAAAKPAAAPVDGEPFWSMGGTYFSEDNLTTF